MTDDQYNELRDDLVLLRTDFNALCARMRSVHPGFHDALDLLREVLVGYRYCDEDPTAMECITSATEWKHWRNKYESLSGERLPNG